MNPRLKVAAIGVLAAVLGGSLVRAGQPHGALFVVFAGAWAGVRSWESRRAGLRRLRLSALQTCLNVSGVLWLSMAVWGPLWMPGPDPSVQAAADFMAFYSGGVLLTEDAAALFDPERQAEVQSRATGQEVPVGAPNFMPFGYPAVVGLLFIPLSLFDYTAAYLAMTGLNLLLLGLAIWLLSESFRLSEESVRVLALAASGLISVYVTLLQGQISFVILLLFGMLARDWRKGREMRVGLWVGLAALKPTLVAAPILWLAARRKWKGLGCALSVAGGLGLISVLLVGINGTRDFLDLGRTMAAAGFPSVNPSVMPNLNSIARFMDWGSTAQLMLTGGVLVALAAPPSPGTDATNRDLAALLLSVILVAPHVHVQELSLLLVVVALTLEKVDRPTVARRWSLFLLMLAPVAPFVLFPPGGPPSPPLISMILLGMFVLSVVGRQRPGGQVQ